MKKNITTKSLFFALGLMLSAQALAHTSSSPDSLRTETKSGQGFVLHKVDAGQTLYAVMRKYKTTIQALKDANPGMKDNLVTGQVIRVPKQAKTTAKQPEIAKKPVPKVEEKPKIEVEEKIVIKPTPIQSPVKEKEPEKPVVKSEPVEEKIVIAAPKAPVVEKEKKEVETPEKTEPQPSLTPVVINKTGIHRVEAGQSLYGIAVKYGVLMSDVRRWNDLSADQLRTGQDLIVSDAAYRDALRKGKIDSVKVADNKPKIADKPTVPPPPPIPSENSNLPDPKIINTGKRIIENGMAEVIDVADNSNKYLALHRTAAIGSLVQVKNASNNQTVWVKVIGKLPNISANDRIIIKVSARAYEKLSPNGRRFLSEISYSSE
jgi:LysM repeat protein